MTDRQRQGLDVIQADGILFTKFKTEVSSHLENPKCITEDDWVELYKFYAERRLIQKELGHQQETVSEFAIDWFWDWNLVEYDTQLKSQYKQQC